MSDAVMIEAAKAAVERTACHASSSPAPFIGACSEFVRILPAALREELTRRTERISILTREISYAEARDGVSRQYQELMAIFDRNGGSPPVALAHRSVHLFETAVDVAEELVAVVDPAGVGSKCLRTADGAERDLLRLRGLFSDESVWTPGQPVEVHLEDEDEKRALQQMLSWLGPVSSTSTLALFSIQTLVRTDEAQKALASCLNTTEELRLAHKVADGLERCLALAQRGARVVQDWHRRLNQISDDIALMQSAACEFLLDCKPYVPDGSGQRPPLEMMVSRLSARPEMVEQVQMVCDELASRVGQSTGSVARDEDAIGQMWFRASDYQKMTNGALYPDLLKEAREAERLIGDQRSPRGHWQYRVADVCRTWPQYRAEIRTWVVRHVQRGDAVAGDSKIEKPKQ